jgi:hypothetical protein
MNDDTNITEYIKSLPQSLQNLLSEGVWEERVNEISKKYSLTPEQSGALSNIVLLTLTFISPPEEMKQNITGDLGISDLLSEQVSSDLETRVFEYAAKQLNVVQKQQAPAPKQTEAPKLDLPVKMEPKVLSVPENFLPIESKPRMENDALDKQLNPRPAVGTSIGVPRYAEGSMLNSTPTNFKPTESMGTVGNIIDKKINSVTTGITTPPAPIKYQRDPYREPLE